MDEQQRERFEAAVERKKAESERRSQDHRPAQPPDAAVAPEQEDLLKEGRQDESGARERSSRHGQVTADKWNQ